ncbi:MAG: hypothetical protein ABSE86_32595 [Bryobacteraceae bacterium]|jgi:putative copper export protein
MTVLRFMQWLESSPAASAMNGPEWAFPVVESLHLIGFAFLIGTIAIVDLRLLGLGMRRQPAAQLDADPFSRRHALLRQSLLPHQDNVPRHCLPL